MNYILAAIFTVLIINAYYYRKHVGRREMVGKILIKEIEKVFDPKDYE